MPGSPSVARLESCGSAAVHRRSRWRRVSSVFFGAVAGVPDDGQPVDSGQARRHQRDPGDRHDVRDPQRRHRPVGRLGRRALRHGGWPSAQHAACACRRSASRSIRTPGSSIVLALLVGHGDRGAERLGHRRAFGVAPFIATLGTLYVARGAALLISDGATFPNLWATRARQHRLSLDRRRQASLGCPFRSG